MRSSNKLLRIAVILILMADGSSATDIIPKAPLENFIPIKPIPFHFPSSMQAKWEKESPHFDFIWLEDEPLPSPETLSKTHTCSSWLLAQKKILASAPKSELETLLNNLKPDKLNTPSPPQNIQWQVPFYTYGGGGENKKKTQNDQGSSGDSQTSQSDQKKTTSAQVSSTSSVRTTLQSLLDIHLQERKTQDQYPLIKHFNETLIKLFENDPQLLAYFSSSEADGIDYVSIQPPGIMRLLKEKFPQAIESGQLKYVFLALDTGELPADLYVNMLRQTPDPLQQHTPPFLDTLTPETAHSMPQASVTDAQYSYLQTLPPQFIQKLVFPKALVTLSFFFLSEILSMKNDSWRIYLIDNTSTHFLPLFIHKKTGKDYRVFFSESTNAFPSHDMTVMQRMDSNFLTLALMNVFEMFSASQATFYFFPVARQKSRFGCLAFSFAEIEILLKMPVIAEQDYTYRAYPPSPVPLAIWSPQFDEVVQSGIMHISVNNAGFKRVLPGSKEHARFSAKLKQVIQEHTTGDDKEKNLSSDKYTFRKLSDYPSEFLDMTQSYAALETLTKDMGEEKKMEIKARIQKTLGLMTINGELKNDANLAHIQKGMEMIIELLQSLERPDTAGNDKS